MLKKTGSNTFYLCCHEKRSRQHAMGAGTCKKPASASFNHNLLCEASAENGATALGAASRRVASTLNQPGMRFPAIRSLKGAALVPPQVPYATKKLSPGLARSTIFYLSGLGKRGKLPRRMEAELASPRLCIAQTSLL